MEEEPWTATISQGYLKTIATEMYLRCLAADGNWFYVTATLTIVSWHLEVVRLFSLFLIVVCSFHIQHCTKNSSLSEQVVLVSRLML